MPYTIIVNDDDSLYGSKKKRLMQRQKLVNELIFVANPMYNGIDMTDATVLLEYLLPISKKYKTEILVLSDEKYKDDYLQYKMPLNTNLTSEAGKVELQLTFVKTELDEYGNSIQRVRKTSATTIDIISISAWSDIIPDSALSSIDERLIKLDAQMRALNDYANILDNNKVDNLTYDKEDESLQLSANGVAIGDKVSIKDMLDKGIPVVNFDADSDNKPEQDDDEDSNIVEF